MVFSGDPYPVLGKIIIMKAIEWYKIIALDGFFIHLILINMDPLIVNYQEIIIESTQTNVIETACEKYSQYKSEPKRILKNWRIY